MKIIDLLLNNKESEQTSIYYQENTYSYQYLYQKVELLKNTIGKINHLRCNIGVILPNSPQYIIAFFSTLMGGNVIVPMYYESSISEIINTINNFDISIIISNNNVIEPILSKKDEIKHKFACVDINLEHDYVVNEELCFPKTFAPNNISVLLGTSGSVSNPKRVMLSDENILSNVSSIINVMEYGQKDRFLVILPLCFSSANTSQLLVAFYLKIPLILYNESLHPAKIIDVCNRYSITATAMVPNLVKILDLYFENNDIKFKTLNSIACGGAPFDSRGLKAIINRNPKIQIANVYGLTEAGPRLCIEKEAIKYPNSVGFPIDNVKIFITKSNEDESVGQIVARGPNIMYGYYKNSTATSQVLKEGYLYTGDLGRIENGRIYILGRTKNIIIVNGINIYPEEVEDVIMLHNAVSDVLVKCKEDNIQGNVPIAYIVPNKIITPKELFDHCKKHLPLFKIPAEFIFVNYLEKTYNGKPKRN